MKKLIKAVAVTACAGAMLCFAGCGSDSPKDMALAEAKKVSEAMGVKNVKFVVKEEKVVESKAKIVLESVVDGKFVGLAIDCSEDEDETQKRITAWVDSIKDKL